MPATPPLRRPILPARRLLAAGLALFCAVAGTASGQQQAPAPESSAPVLARFNHTAFTARQGAPMGIRAMVQAPDGMIWLGARDGLWRFDGLSFEHVDGPRGAAFTGASVSSLLVTRQGEVWAGFGGSGGVAAYRHGALVDMKLPDPPPQVVNLAQGPDGAIWAQWGGIGKRLWRFAAGRWALMDDALKLPPGYLFAMLPRRDGSLWLPVMSPKQDGAGLAELRPGETTIRWHPGHFQYPNLAEDARGQLWVADRQGVRAVDGAGRPLGRTWPGVTGTGLPRPIFDRRGALWETTRTKGLLHIAAPGQPGGQPDSRVDTMTAQDGLTSDQVHLAMEDRNGAIWVSTEEGLDRFTLPAMAMAPAIRTSPIDGIGLTRDAGGTVHIINHGLLYDMSAHAPPRVRMQFPRETALCDSGDKALWLVDSKAMFRLEGRSKLSVSALPVDMPFACLRDRQGRSWVLGQDHKVWWQNKGRWQQAGQGQNLLLPGAGLRLDSTGTVAFADGLDAVTLVEGSRFRRIGLAPLKMGRLVGIDPDGGGFLLSMDMGLVRLRGGHMQALRVKDQPWLRGLRTVVRGSGDTLWFYGQGRVAMVAGRDLDAAFDHPGQPVPRRMLDGDDGIPSTMQHPGFIGPQAVAGDDGRLWLASAKGIAMLDPRNLPPAPPAPSVQVTRLDFGGKTMADPAAPVLPPGSSTIRLSYASPGQAGPEHLRFRYRLDGVDDGWIEAETRRATTYSNLAPGTYAFHVQAARGDAGFSGTDSASSASGLWGPESVMRFTIRPSFLQDWPFKLLCAACALLVLWLAYHARMRAVSAHVRLRMAERHDERERIARELHDTLLQSIQGLILHVDAATQDLPPREPARAALGRALDNAQDAVLDLRERVETLRRPELPGDLEGLIEHIAQDVLGDSMVHRIEITGARQDLSPLALHELSRIAREVFFNALRHARASGMLVAITYRRGSLTVGFADDGIGLDPAVLEAGARPGHFGLPGLRERALVMQGRIAMTNGASGGLETIVTIPARIAYADPQGLWQGLLSWLRED